MKIRPSLRLYFFISIVLLGSSMTIGFSVLGVNYFIEGLDRGIGGIMHELVMTTDVQDGHPVKFVDIQVASRWQDTPKIIQQRFTSPPTQENELLKMKDQDSLFSLPKNLFFVTIMYNQNNETRYVSKVMLDKTSLHKKRKKHISLFTWIIITGVSVMAVFACLLIVVMRKVAKPIESLKDWAKSLTQENIQQSPPDFIYNELNTLASIVRGSLLSVHQSLAREQRFLSYASHELRTPISVIRSNVDLLKRLSEQSPISDKQNLTLQRIERAGLTMSDLTDTLLWLSRNDEQTVSLEPVNLDENISQLCNELGYLLNGKQVEVEIQSEKFTLHTAATACHIVLSNLIRNAYQHTQQGKVQIEQQGSCVTITNISEDNEDSDVSHDNDKNRNPLGYGLGLQLSEKIIQRHGWQCEIVDLPAYYQVKVNFMYQN